MRLSSKKSFVALVLGAFLAGTPAGAHTRHHHSHDYGHHGYATGQPVREQHFGMPNYAPPPPIPNGLFNTGLFSGSGLIGLGVLGL